MKYLYTLIIALLCLSACNSDEDKAYYFIGDQMLDNMDLDTAFPSKHIVDCAVSGRHLTDLIESPIAVPSDGVAVVLLGMHDISAGASYLLDYPNYYNDYEQMIRNLGAERVVLIGMIPSQNASRNANYFAFNKEMKRRFEEDARIEFYDITYRFVDEDDLLDVQYARYDGLLLNDFGYQLLGEIINKKL